MWLFSLFIVICVCVCNFIFIIVSMLMLLFYIVFILFVARHRNSVRPSIITSVTTSCWDVGALVYNYYVISTVELPIVQTFELFRDRKRSNNNNSKMLKWRRWQMLHIRVVMLCSLTNQLDNYMHFIRKVTRSHKCFLFISQFHHFSNYHYYYHRYLTVVGTRE